MIPHIVESENTLNTVLRRLLEILIQGFQNLQDFLAHSIITQLAAY